MGRFSRLLSLPIDAIRRKTRRNRNGKEDQLNILDLPDVFLRELMKKLTLKDRLSLRNTCRALENLVAPTHAGLYDSAQIVTTSMIIEKTDWLRRKYLGTKEIVLFRVGNVEMKIPVKDFEAFLNFLGRLFRGICLGTCTVEIHDNAADFKFISKSIKKFKIGLINLIIDSVSNFKNWNSFICDFPETKFSVKSIYCIRPEQLMALPPLERLEIPCGHALLSVLGITRSPVNCTSSQFLTLVSTHKFISFLNANLSPEDLELALETVGSIESARTIHLTESTDIIEEWMRHFGTARETKVGDKCGKFIVTERTRATDDEGLYCDTDVTCLRYNNCWIEFEIRRFLHGGALLYNPHGIITIGNGEDPGTEAERVLLSGS